MFSSEESKTKRKIQKVKGSFTVVIPKEYVDDLKLKEGERLDFRIDGKQMIVTPVAPILQEREQQTATPAAIPTFTPEVKNIAVSV